MKNLFVEQRRLKVIPINALSRPCINVVQDMAGWDGAQWKVALPGKCEALGLIPSTKK
jgi:hypothetical protein